MEGEFIHIQKTAAAAAAAAPPRPVGHDLLTTVCSLAKQYCHVSMCPTAIDHGIELLPVCHFLQHFCKGEWVLRTPAVWPLMKLELRGKK